MATGPFESFGDVSDDVSKRYLNAETAANPRIVSFSARTIIVKGLNPGVIS